MQAARSRHNRACWLVSTIFVYIYTTSPARGALHAALPGSAGQAGLRRLAYSLTASSTRSLVHSFLSALYARGTRFIVSIFNNLLLIGQKSSSFIHSMYQNHSIPFSSSSKTDRTLCEPLTPPPLPPVLSTS